MRGTRRTERTVHRAAGAFGRRTSLVLVPDGAVVTVGAGPGRVTTVTVRAVPEVFRLGQVVAFKPLLAVVREGRLPVARARERLRDIEEQPAPYPWWWKLTGIVLFALGFAPLMQPTWYEIGSTAVLAVLAAALAVALRRGRGLGPAALGPVLRLDRLHRRYRARLRDPGPAPFRFGGVLRGNPERGPFRREPRGE
ncbi:threonine/serine exporter family protein [Streptomyces sp. LRE541]|uniref:threonine/serine exporter family protein n=1 Tax=Streptomyces sp. LRE541 TaxID=2931983 RepID=UPI002010A9D1|nr:threonine/serine exporter family protein [Streptomyces sp. LRE541]UPZ26961.1 threonine/serine exporter family protein [Streptomyces sp. LRE541]